MAFESTGRDDKDTRKKIAHARIIIIGCLNSIFWSNGNRGKKKEMKFILKVTCGAETWRLIERYKRKIESVEMYIPIKIHFILDILGIKSKRLSFNLKQIRELTHECMFYPHCSFWPQLRPLDAM